MPSKQSMSYLASFSTSKLKENPCPTCLLVSQSLAAPVLVCHLRLGAPLLTSALISRAPRGRRVLENSHVFVKLDSCPGSVFGSSERWNCGRVPKSKHSSSNSSVVYLRISHQNTASCSFITSLSSGSAYSRPSASNKAALSTEMVGILAGLWMTQRARLLKEVQALSP
jgi:hypothetical protein